MNTVTKSCRILISPRPIFLVTAALCVAALWSSRGVASPAQTIPEPATEPTAPLMNPDHQTLITLHTKDATPREVFDSIAKQAGITFQTSPLNLWDSVDGAANVDYDKQPFWQIVHELALSYDVSPSINSSPRHITLTHNPNSPWLKQPAIIAGPLLLNVSSISYSRQINYAQDQSQTNLSLELSGFVDPNARFINYATSLDVTEATDDHDNSLRLPVAVAPRRYPDFHARNRLLFVNINVRLQYPAANPGTKIVKLKGSLSAMMLTKAEPLTFDDLKAVDTTKTAGGFTIVLHDVAVQENNRLVAVHLTVTPPNVVPRVISGPIAVPRRNAANPLNDPMLIANLVELVDADGHAYMNQGVSSVSGGTAGQTNMTINFGPDYAIGPRAAAVANLAPVPGKLAVEIPVDSKEITIPIELSDIKMP